MTDKTANQAAPSKRELDWTNVAFLTLTPLFALIATPIYIYYSGFHWADLGIFLVFYWAAGLSITMGYHRLFTHKAYEAHPIVKFFLLCFGAAALENSVYKWSSDHRVHHQHVDQEIDPYNAKKGFWYSHIFWIFYKDRSGRNFENVKDLANDPLVMWQKKYYLPLAFGVGWLLPLLIGFAFGRPFGFFLWGGVIRTVMVQHNTFFINSLAHMVGKQTYDDQTTAKDSWWIALVSFGEGYHNFHHRFQRDYRNGVRWFHWDPSKWIIRFLEVFGLTHNLRRYPDAQILSQRLAMDVKRVRTSISSERWQSICDELEYGRVVVEKTLADWKSTLGEYAKWKEKAPIIRAEEMRLEFKEKIRKQRQIFEQSLKEWNEKIQFHLSTQQLALA